MLMYGQLLAALRGFRAAAAARGAGAGLLERVAAVTGCGSAPAFRLKPVAAERRLSCRSASLPSRPPSSLSPASVLLFFTIMRGCK